jgi:hypothetical protein
MGDSMNKKIIGILICVTLILTVLPVSGIIVYNGYNWQGSVEKNKTPSTISLTDKKYSLSYLGRNNSPPYQPSNPFPANGSINVSIDVDLNWTGGDPDGNNVTYVVYFGNTSTPPLVSNNQTNVTYNPGILDYNTTYYWQIVAWDNQSAFNSSLLWEFLTVQFPPVNQPPFEPTNPYPPHGAVNVSLDEDLNWTGGDPDGDNVTYNVYFGTNSTPAMVSNNQTATNFDPGILNDNMSYYWQIVAWDEFNLSNQSDLWNFTTKLNFIPNQPFNESPVNGSTSVGINIELSWECSDPDNDSLTYDILFGNLTPPPVVAHHHPNSTYDLETLETEETYFWQIVAWDDYGGFNASPIWQFSTQENSPPYPPQIIAGPEVGGPEIDLNFTAFTTDPEGDEVSYMFDWGDGNTSDWIGPFEVSTPVKVNYRWNRSGDYVIKVKAKDIEGKEGGWSEEYNLSVFTQIEINNLKPGFVYFHILTFTGSYLFLQAFEFLGICGVISTGKILFVNSSVSEHVNNVKFETLQILWNLTSNEWDNDMSDGCEVIMNIAAGLYQLSATAYDDEGNIIDQDIVPYLLYFCRSQSGSGGQLRLGRVIANRFTK